MSASAGASGSISVADALRLDAIREGSPVVVAAPGRLDRPIRWVHAGELSNIADLLKGGELLLTTGMGIGHEPDTQREFVRRLVERGVAALALELGHVFAEVPPALVYEAERFGLPLIVFEREVRFVDITEAVHENLMARQAREMQLAEAVRRRLTDLLLSGAELDLMLRELALAVQAPVGIETERGQIVADAWVAPAAQRAALGTADLRAAIRDGAPARRWQFGPSGEILVVLMGEKIDAVAVEAALGPLALALRRGDTTLLVEMRERAEFLDGVRRGRIDPAAAPTIAHAMGLGVPRETLVPLALGGLLLAELPGSFWRHLRTELRNRGINALIGFARPDDTALGILGVAGMAARDETVARFASIVHMLLRQRVGESDGVAIAAGSAAQDWSGIAGGLADADEAARAGTMTGPKAWHDATVADANRLLVGLATSDSAQTFCDRQLGSVIEHDRRRNGALLATLEALTAHGWRRGDAARELAVERQTLHYRLRRIESILGQSFDDPNTRFAVELAVRLRALRQAKARHQAPAGPANRKPSAQTFRQ